ncbi:DUF4468 domain-containing protein [Salinivibrio kushneri]|uniref:DUF4468 domain-containing protein n=1 Tax=Salinivibrio kushneri TaxID=1908198 RepID=UPI000C8439D7|nr:DUF4468 domain-containing protein [Salinivibrio kushneri]
MKNVIFIIAVMLLFLQGCTSPNSPNYPISPSDIEPQTYTYLELNGDKSEVWKKARNHIATVYGDSKDVMRVGDESEGSLLGKGLIQWKMMDSAISPYCYSKYDIRFLAKDGKARLQLELLPGAPAGSECVGWTLPSKHGYNQVLEKFESMAKRFEKSLRGEGSLETMSDF